MYVKMNLKKKIEVYWWQFRKLGDAMYICI